ncbi:DUF2971 domain-containing protein [Algibacter sp. TI.3.09]|uniref:DUF2971 domain-containing protein n=1 Tax=Algibacter sp. TI.3.09 TaxID=3121298 RepID=UPI00311E823A
MSEIDDIFNSTETLYHFTKTQTAYEYILHTNKLKFSGGKMSNDPIENNVNLNLGKSFFGYKDTKRADNEISDKASDYIKEKIKNLKQVCFCKNNKDPKFAREMVVPDEYYGFLKPRMWDQYGDKYNGVCLVFDKSKLKKNNYKKHSGDVNYIGYDDLVQNNYDIDLNILYESGLEKYCNDNLERIRKNSFLKHKDYAGENEYRFISFSKTEDYLEIGDSLKAIIISKKELSDFSQQWFSEFTEKNKVKLFYINWDREGFCIENKKDYDDLSF